MVSPLTTPRALWLSLMALVLFAINHTRAAPHAAANMTRRASITTVSDSQIEAFTPYSYYASAGYCDATSTRAWNCGKNCEANPSFVPIASGGDGTFVQFWFVGYDPTLKMVVVSHQGTHPEAILPLILDGDILLDVLDSTLFPGLGSSIEVHQGFAGAHSESATDVLNAVQKGISQYGTDNVLLTGHSLGAAISLLHTVYLPLHIPNIKMTFVGYGLPRVGNKAFANYIDAHDAIASVTHINNKKDLVPILPGMFLGYHHPSGEIHIQSSGAWLACPGQDNESDKCIVGDVPTIFESKESDHDGPYNGVTMGC